MGFQFYTLRPRQNDRHLVDDIFKCIFLNENVWISIEISLKFAPKGSVNNIPVLGQIMTWRRPGDKPLPEPMMIRLPTHICVTRPQWVDSFTIGRPIYRRDQQPIPHVGLQQPNPSFIRSGLLMFRCHREFNQLPNFKSISTICGKVIVHPLDIKYK